MLFAFILGMSIIMITPDGASGLWFIGICVGLYGLVHSLVNYFNQKKLNQRSDDSNEAGTQQD